jgi:hypothetical protein
MQSERGVLLVTALRLSYFTIAWNGVAGAAALVAAIIASSPALAAFALNALLDSWRLQYSFGDSERNDATRPAADGLEQRAHSWIALATLVVGVYVVVEGVRAIVGGSHSEESAVRPDSRHALPARPYPGSGGGSCWSVSLS